MGVGIVSEGIWESAWCEVLAVRADADARSIPKDQRQTHENAFAPFQAEVESATPLVTDVATVFLVGRIVGIIQTHRRVALEGGRVGIPHDGIDGVSSVIGDPKGLQGDRVVVRVFAIRQEHPRYRSGGGGIWIEWLNAIVGLPAAVARWHQTGRFLRPGDGDKQGSGGEKGRQKNRRLDNKIGFERTPTTRSCRFELNQSIHDSLFPRRRVRFPIAGPEEAKNQRGRCPPPDSDPVKCSRVKSLGSMRLWSYFSEPDLTITNEQTRHCG